MWNVDFQIPIPIPEFWNVECGMWISEFQIPNSKILELESRFDTGCCLGLLFAGVGNNVRRALEIDISLKSPLPSLLLCCNFNLDTSYSWHMLEGIGGSTLGSSRRYSNYLQM